MEQRLGELGRGDGDFTDLKRPSAATVSRARGVAAATFRQDTPTPSVVPTEDGEVAFIWHKNGIDAEITVEESGPVHVWAHDRGLGESWSGSLDDHRTCCVARLLDELEREAVSTQAP